MANENWQQIRKIFDESLLRNPEERRQYISKMCGADKLLFAEVESLLASHDRADGFMETPAIAKVAGAIEAETKKLEKGVRFGHYEIVKQLGAGGMGEVYLATDKKLDRQIAVKILNEKFSRDATNLRRFVAEAKAASALNHPNILVIHEIGEANEVHYIISEFIKGKTLREIFKDEPLKLLEVLDISIQIAGALCTAHEARLVHRDIKPENIMIRPDGYVKILDFGLAKLVEQKNKSTLGLESDITKQNQTAKGVILGTVNYMSPEQAKGERVDERTDIFSFGAVIYEMIAGKTPFAGESVSERFANLINAEPPPLADFSADVPDELQRIVSKMLEKNKTERFQTTKNLLADLKNLQKRLDFEIELTRSRQRATRSDTSQAQAISCSDAPSGNLKPPAAINSESLIIKNMKPPENASEAYRQSRFYYQRGSFPDIIKSRSLLEEALRFDANYAPAYAALADQFVVEAVYGLHAPAESFVKAKDALGLAFALDSNSAEFYAAAGFVDLICDWNFAEAESSLRKSLELDPRCAVANNYLGQVFMFQCRFAEAEVFLRRATEIEPAVLYHQGVVIISYFLARKHEKVIEESERILAVHPQFLIAAHLRCATLEQTGRAAEAVAEYEKILHESGEIALRWLGCAYALVGEKGKAREIAAKLVAESRRRYISPTFLALLYIALNEPDEAFAYLEKAFQDNDPWLIWINADPRYDVLRSDARFQDLLRRVGFPDDENARNANERRIFSRSASTIVTKENSMVAAAPKYKNATAPFQAATSDANRQTAETQDKFSQNIKPRKWLFAAALLSIVALAAIGFIRYKFANRLSSNFEAKNISRITSNGKVQTAAVSPDGKFVAYVQQTGETQSLRMRQIASLGETQIIAPANDKIRSVNFSPDGNSIYYIIGRTGFKGSLFQTPLFGGQPKKIADNIYLANLAVNGIGFAPDGKQIAFIRLSPPPNDTSFLMIADADGANERTLISYKRPDLLVGTPAWSPDGETVVCPFQNGNGMNAMAIKVADAAAATLLPTELNAVSQIVWQPDGQNLLMVAEDDVETTLYQIYQFAYTGGERRRVNKDFNNYESLSLSADGRNLVAIRTEQNAHLWTMPTGDAGLLKQITEGFEKYDGISGMGWLPDGKIYYESMPGGKQAILQIDSVDGTGKQMATGGGFGAASPDGRFLVYEKSGIKDNHLAQGLFLFDTLDASEQQLTNGWDVYAEFAPDGKSINFIRWGEDAEMATLRNIPAEGGSPAHLTTFLAITAASSPDGKSIAVARWAGAKTQIVIIPASGGEPTKTFDIDFSIQDRFGRRAIQWTADGRGIAFIRESKGISNIWQQPIDGGEPQPITNFVSDEIFNFAFSSDGKHLALSRGTINSDVILINNPD